MRRKNIDDRLVSLPGPETDKQNTTPKRTEGPGEWTRRETKSTMTMMTEIDEKTTRTWVSAARAGEIEFRSGREREREKKESFANSKSRLDEFFAARGRHSSAADPSEEANNR